MMKCKPRLFNVVGTLALALVGALIASVTACDSDEATESSSGTPGGSPNALPDGRIPRDANANCVKPGTPNNEQGLGGYCEKLSDCVEGKSTCTGVLGAPDDAWFCTRLCDKDPDCGEGLYCAHDPRGIACVPIVCGDPDAGAQDASADSPASD